MQGPTCEGRLAPPSWPGSPPELVACIAYVGTSRMCRELGLLNGRHFDVVRLVKHLFACLAHPTTFDY